MTDPDRVSHHIARLVRDEPGQTPGATARRLAGRDRHLFVKATVRAVKLGWVVVREGKLYPGPKKPGPSTRGNTAAALAEALKS